MADDKRPVIGVKGGGGVFIAHNDFQTGDRPLVELEDAEGVVVANNRVIGPPEVAKAVQPQPGFWARESTKWVLGIVGAVIAGAILWAFGLSG